MRCDCICCFKRDGKQRSGRCRNFAFREVRVHQENEHRRIGTGWYWVALCDKHFFDSDLKWSTEKLGQDWRWLRS